MIRVRVIKNISASGKLYDAKLFVCENDELNTSEGGNNILRDPTTMVELERRSLLHTRAWNTESALNENIQSIIEDARLYVTKKRRELRINTQSIVYTL